MTVDIAMEGEEEVVPRMAGTWAGLVHVASEAEAVSSLPLARARATLTPLAMDPQAS